MSMNRQFSRRKFAKSALAWTGLLFVPQHLAKGVIYPMATRIPLAVAGGGGGVTTLFSDNFDRADNTALGANWTEGNGDSQILSNVVRLATAASTPRVLATTTTAHAAVTEQSVSVTQVSATGDGGPFARCTNSTSTPTFYFADCAANAIQVYRHNASSTGTAVGSAASITQAANKIIKLTVTGTGATVTIKVSYNGVQVLNFTDTDALRLVTAGQTGIANWAGTAALCDYNDFLVETA